MEPTKDSLMCILKHTYNGAITQHKQYLMGGKQKSKTLSNRGVYVENKAE